MVKKKITKIIVALLLIPVILISPLILFYGVFFAPLPVVYITGQIERNQIRDEIFEYVIENKDDLEQTDAEHRQYFEYADKGFIDSGVIYGYFYSPHDEYQNYSTPYRNGYLRYGSPNSGEDWCYFEKICDNWYCYEEHYG